MLDFIGTIAITTVMVVVINAVISTLPARPLHRLVLAVLLGAWIGLSVALGSIGAYDDAGQRAFPLIGVMFVIPLIAVSLAAVWSPAVRAALLGLPMPLLIGLNAARVFGILFVLLAVAGRLGGPFPYSAGWGDVITGMLAVPLAWLATRTATSDWLIGAWNAFGALDLILAVFFGMTSASGSALQLFEAGVGSAAMQHLPWALVPTVLVPFFLITHAIIFAQLRARAGRPAGLAAAKLP